MSTSKTLLFLASLFIIFNSNTCLICKNCNVDCGYANDELCLDPGEDLQVGCLTETFTDENSNNTHQQKKCVLYAKNSRFQCVDYPQYESSRCEVCHSDRCNAAPSGAEIGRVPVQGSTGRINVTVINDTRSVNYL